MSLQIEEGCYYRSREGAVVGPIVRLGGDWRNYPFKGGGETFTSQGACVLNGEVDRRDLIEQVEAPSGVIFHDAIDRVNSAETISVTCGNNSLTDVENVPTTVDRDRLEEQESANTGADLAAETFAPLDQILTMRATDIAGKASNLVGGDRDRQHGAKRDNFSRIAATWNAWLAIRRDPAAPLSAHDVGVMMAFMKLARTQSGSLNIDDYIDACGYAACAGEVAQVVE